ncbi:hypothetical protein K443DRAFT_685429 [Laccaria amethystina LaAM-08-1]|uniref:Uncharacterized protein n=1 Tax=Laccaria amethystina LaAM-08-1 TaxID=1095629 RepID=A0A0C9X6V1_9AGAR|nr:hypothetical protein K443DRAFT_685429 [Laccaria amethystina LaAM-08-1]
MSVSRKKIQKSTLKILSWRAEDTRTPDTGSQTDCHLTPSQRRTLNKCYRPQSR